MRSLGRQERKRKKKISRNSSKNKERDPSLRDCGGQVSATSATTATTNAILPAWEAAEESNDHVKNDLRKEKEKHFFLKSGRSQKQRADNSRCKQGRE